MRLEANRLSIILLCLLVAPVVGCNKNKSGIEGSGPRIQTAYTLNNNPNDSANCDGYTCGAITMARGDSQEEFQFAVDSFLGLDEQDLGVVSGIAGQSTGVRFYASAPFIGGVDCYRSVNNAQIDAARAVLTIMVFDSFAVSEGERAIKINYSGAIDGSVQGNRVYVAFEDPDFGDVVSLDATLINGRLDGYLLVESPENPDVNGHLAFSVPAGTVVNCR